jgi:hypothetical protein
VAKSLMLKRTGREPLVPLESKLVCVFVVADSALLLFFLLVDLGVRP